jgi:hypothetical protein
MTIRRADDGTIWLVDECPAEDADLLLQYLLERQAAPMDWSLCLQAHTAVVQVLVANGRCPAGTPKGIFLKDVIGPALGGPRTASSGFRGLQGDAK